MTLYTCFPEGKAKALTMSYDDGKMQDKRLVKIFNESGIRCTFNLNYGLMGTHPRLSREEVLNLYDGHEIAVHTLTHPTIARIPGAMAAQEILEDRKGLESMFGGPIRGLAYPNGSYSEEVKALAKGLGIAYARTVNSTHSFDLPTDPLEWNPTCHHNDPKLMEMAEEFANFKKPQYMKIFYVWGHSYEFDNDDNWNVIEEFCEYIGGREDIWYATNGEIIEYMETAARLQYYADGTKVYNPSAKDAWIKVDKARVVCAKGGEITDLT